MKKLITSLCVAVATSIAFAETTPAMLSLFTPIQIPTEDVSVKGIRYDFIYGTAADFTGLDLGLVNRTKGTFYGVAFGGGNIVENGGTGAELGFVNFTGSFTGLQWGFLNFAKGEYKGLQLGFCNYVSTMNKGVQLGLINFIDNNGFMPVFPFVNAGF